MNILTRGTTMTGRMKSRPQVQQLPMHDPAGAVPVPDLIDTRLLNSLEQPTAYAKRLRRYEALNRYLTLTQQLATARLSGYENVAGMLGKKVEKYQAMYQFTEEECDARIKENNRLRY